jgi:hypothetical protein
MTAGGRAVPLGTVSASGRIPYEPALRSGATTEIAMARKYSRSAGKDVKRAMHRKKKGTLKRGKGGKGGTVKSRKQAIAIGLSEARKKGKKVPKRKTKKKSSRKKSHT